MANELYRDISIRAYGTKEKQKIDALRGAGVNLTELVLNAIMKADIEKLTERN